jgi:anthranilate phosphoribosyltransferase
VVCGAGGYDEVAPLGPASVIFVNGFQTAKAELDPAEYGIPPCREEDLAVNGPEDAGRALRQILQGAGPKPMRDMLTLNLGLSLYILDSSYGQAEAKGYNTAAMSRCMEEAKAAVAAGAGRRFVHA